MRYHGVSRWAAPFVNDEPPEAPEAVATVIARHDEAASRSHRYGRSALVWTLWAIGALAAEGLSSGWFATLFFWAFIACGLTAMRQFYEYRCARIETSVWPF